MRIGPNMAHGSQNDWIKILKYFITSNPQYNNKIISTSGI